MRRTIITLSGVAAAACIIAARGATNGSPVPACAPDNAGITLPAGLCASLFADSVTGARHLAVAPNGDVIVSSSGRGAAGVWILRDENRDGRADSRSRFATGYSTSEVAIFDNHLYAENGSAVLRYPYKVGDTVSQGAPDTVVGGLPRGGGHGLKTFAITREGVLFVNIGSSANVCPGARNGQPAPDPCTEIETRAGIWRFDARKLNQTQPTGVHYARGIRNAVGLAIHPTDGALWVVQHGRDELKTWPAYYTAQQSAELPSEELFRVDQGGDYGYPYCFFDHLQGKKILAPEYGGNGKDQGKCATLKSNVAAFPGHWAPNALLFYTGSLLPAKYRNGAFIAFHGSWNRAPEPQAGFNVVFQPITNNRASGPYEIFADGFAPMLGAGGGRGRGPSPDSRPTGLAQGPDGALYISDDARGRIWKVVTAGGR